MAIVFIIRDIWPSGGLLVAAYSNLEAAQEHKAAIDLVMGSARHQCVVSELLIEDIFAKDTFPWNVIEWLTEDEPACPTYLPGGTK